MPGFVREWRELQVLRGVPSRDVHPEMPQVRVDPGRRLFTVGGFGVQHRAGGVDEATAAVIAHQLLTSLAVIAGTTGHLRERWHELTDADRALMLNCMEACAVETAQHLRVIAK